ncbi:MAG: DUF177 domain-containing protein [Candidatus Omnitrophica bacterium]|nr:DUF177 domain-containing protein [Candidatus Omnitrophota bacterium]
MKIKVREISSSGLLFEESVNPRDIGLLEDFINDEVPLTVTGRFERVGDFILAKVDVVYGVENHCARCLERVSGQEKKSFDLDFEAKAGVEYIDVGERVREEVIIGYVPRVLCKEDCKGICPGCGADLNTESCECEKKH